MDLNFVDSYEFNFVVNEFNFVATIFLNYVATKLNL